MAWALRPDDLGSDPGSAASRRASGDSNTYSLGFIKMKGDKSGAVS